MSDKRLFLLDAMALIYRAHFAFIRNPRITSDGLNTSAIFGFTNSLLDLLNNQNATHIGVAFDTMEPTFRHEEYPEYKAGREEIPEDIVTAIPLVKRLLKALNIPILEMSGYEADDIIGTMAKAAEKDGYKVYMVTPDKDFAQLVTSNVFLYKPARMGKGMDILDPQKVKEKMGIPPEHVTDFLGLKGDSVDNIPGIPKVGDKTAVELIEQFGTVEEIVKNAENISKNSIRKTVQEHAEQGLLSKKLATIKLDVPVPWEEEDLKVGNPDRKATIDLMKELEFRTTAQRILDSPVFVGDKPKQKDLFGNDVKGEEKQIKFEAELKKGFDTLEDRDHTYHLLGEDYPMDKLVKAIEKAGSFCFDTETTSLDPMSAELVAVTFCIEEGEAFLLHIPENEKDPKKLLAPFKPLFESNDILKTGQNLKYDMLMLMNYGITVDGPLFDTMIADYVINPDRAHSMDAMAREHLNYDPVSITKLIGKKGKHQLSMRQVKLEDLKAYACEDADITLALKTYLEPSIKKDELSKVFDQVELPLIPVLTQMEFYGIKVDKDFLNTYSKALEKDLNRIEKEIFELAGMQFNVNSPKQLGEILFDRLKLAKGKKTKTGQYSTREEILVELAEEHEMPAKVLMYRRLGKLKSTYVDALPTLINKKTGRVHSTFSQAVAATGRLSSNNPNLQNIPIRTDEGREIRKAFVPEEGYTLLSADYSQVELRLMAEMSKDSSMMEDFKAGHDIHKATAARVFGVELDEVTSDMRARAKMVNFGIIYGISAFGLGQRLKISRTEAAEIIDNYFDKYPGIKKYMDECIDAARENGYASTMMGRRRYLPDINSNNRTVRGFAERNAINTPIQGSAAELIKIAMINIHRIIKEKGYTSRMLLQVHDELVFEVAENERDEFIEMVKQNMENAVEFEVPMIVESGTGNNWLEAH